MRVGLVFIFVYNIAFLLIYVCIEMNLTDDFRDIEIKTFWVIWKIYPLFQGPLIWSCKTILWGHILHPLGHHWAIQSQNAQSKHMYKSSLFIAFSRAWYFKPFFGNRQSIKPITFCTFICLVLVLNFNTMLQFRYGINLNSWKIHFD